MKISEYIKALETIRAEHGDLELDTMSVDGCRRPACSPKVGFRKILKGRESKPAFWYEWASDCVGRQGDKVCVI